MLRSITNAIKMSSTTHLAAILHSKGAQLSIEERTTPTPGPNELLIEVKSIALNPLDIIMRDVGYTITHYPAIPGSDISGTVLKAGAGVPSTTPKIGARVLALAPAFAKQGKPDYGGFQTRVVVPVENVCPIPDDLSFNEAAILPMACITSWSAVHTLGIARDTKYSASNKQGFLVWGGSSSLGSAMIQLAKSMGFIVYTTASEKHDAYLKELGASKTFDYHDEDVIDQIVEAVKEDGVTMQYGLDAIGFQFASCIEVLKQTGNGAAKLATSKGFGDTSPSIPEVDVLFVKGLQGDARSEFSRFVFNGWLKEKLEKKEWTPSPKIEIVDGGLQSVNLGLDKLKSGISCTKLVIEV
jgi:NADPH:quinone reductase-like Zn-dependent oxidoreductase